MDMELIMQLVTIVVTIIMGVISKKSKYISNNVIPIQNVVIGVIMTIIHWVITKDFSIAVTLSGIAGGGVYDIPHNLKKLLHKGDE